MKKIKNLICTLILAFAIIFIAGNSTQVMAAPKTVKYGDTLKVKYRYKSDGIAAEMNPKLKKWSKWHSGKIKIVASYESPFMEDGTEPYDTRLLLQCQKAVGKKVGSTFTILQYGGNGDTTYQYKIKKIIRESQGRYMTTGAHAVKKGKYIYYSYNMRGKRMGIVRVDTTTMKKKTICTYKLKGRQTNGYDNLVLHGNYIYCTFDEEYGTSESDNYICKINIKTGKRKILTKGERPVIRNGKVYFRRYDYYSDEGDQDGIYTMSFSGAKSSIKKVSDEYYLIQEPDNTEFEYVGRYLIYRTTNYPYAKVTLVRPNGKKKVLAKWVPGE